MANQAKTFAICHAKSKSMMLVIPDNIKTVWLCKAVPHSITGRPSVPILDKTLRHPSLFFRSRTQQRARALLDVDAGETNICAQLEHNLNLSWAGNGNTLCSAGQRQNHTNATSRNKMNLVEFEDSDTMVITSIKYNLACMAWS